MTKNDTISANFLTKHKMQKRYGVLQTRFLHFRRNRGKEAFIVTDDNLVQLHPTSGTGFDVTMVSVM